MPDIASLVQSLGGIAQKRQLVARGARDLDLTAAVRSGEVIRVRNGWYSTLSEQDPQLRAVRVGGRLTGISVLIARGAWVLGDHPLHVSVHSNAARLRTQWNRRKPLDVRAPRGVRVHWEERDVRGRGTAASVGLMDALRRVILDEEFETAVAVVDWALHTTALDLIDFETLIMSLPEERRGIRDWVDAACESLPESLSRTRFRLSGHVVVSQVPLDDRRIDLVVDEIAGIEVDGEEHHWNRFEPDRSKDIDITIANLHALRPSARTVFYDWERFALAVEIAIAARRPARENSGLARRNPFATHGMTGWLRRPRRKTPEYPWPHGIHPASPAVTHP
jgi:very-short-patch-repair endonuclease